MFIQVWNIIIWNTVLLIIILSAPSSKDTRSHFTFNQSLIITSSRTFTQFRETSGNVSKGTIMWYPFLKQQRTRRKVCSSKLTQAPRELLAHRVVSITRLITDVTYAGDGNPRHCGSPRSSGISAETFSWRCNIRLISEMVRDQETRPSICYMVFRLIRYRKNKYKPIV